MYLTSFVPYGATSLHFRNISKETRDFQCNDVLHSNVSLQEGGPQKASFRQNLILIRKIWSKVARPMMAFRQKWSMYRVNAMKPNNGLFSGNFSLWYFRFIFFSYHFVYFYPPPPSLPSLPIPLLPLPPSLLHRVLVKNVIRTSLVLSFKTPLPNKSLF